jgi:hypothetical protein
MEIYEKEFRTTPKGWVVGDLEFSIDNASKVVASFKNTEEMTTPRPKTAEEIGANREALERLNRRIPGSYECRARMGAGIAFFLEDIMALHWGKPELATRITDKYNIDQRGFVGSARSWAAPGTFGQIDTCSGVPSRAEILVEGIPQISELGFYQDDGWGKFVLPHSLAPYQKYITRAQQSAWESLTPGFPMKYEVPLTLMETEAPDKINNLHCVLSGEQSSGSFEIVIPVMGHLSGRDWLVRDGEILPDGTPLNRTIYVICRQLDGAPLAFRFGMNGFDLGSLVTVLEGQNADPDHGGAINSKVGKTLKAIGWFSPES